MCKFKINDRVRIREESYKNLLRFNDPENIRNVTPLSEGIIQQILTSVFADSIGNPIILFRCKVYFPEEKTEMILIENCLTPVEVAKGDKVRHRDYIITADIARGDGSDFSATKLFYPVETVVHSIPMQNTFQYNVDFIKDGITTFINELAIEHDKLMLVQVFESKQESNHQDLVKAFENLTNALKTLGEAITTKISSPKKGSHPKKKTKNSLQVEVGKFYRTRDNRIANVINKRDGSDSFPYKCRFLSDETHHTAQSTVAANFAVRSDGKWSYDSRQSKFDLIEEVKLMHILPIEVGKTYVDDQGYIIKIIPTTATFSFTGSNNRDYTKAGVIIGSYGIDQGCGRYLKYEIVESEQQDPKVINNQQVLTDIASKVYEQGVHLQILDEPTKLIFKGSNGFMYTEEGQAYARIVSTDFNIQ